MSNQVCLLCLQVIDDTGAKSPQKIGTKALRKLLTLCHHSFKPTHHSPPDFENYQMCDFCDVCYPLFSKMEEIKSQIYLLEDELGSNAVQIKATMLRSHQRNNVEDETIKIRNTLLQLTEENFGREEDEVHVKVEEWDDDLGADPLGDLGDQLISDDINSYSDASMEKLEDFIQYEDESAFCNIPYPQTNWTIRKENTPKCTSKRKREDSPPTTDRYKKQPPTHSEVPTPRIFPRIKQQTNLTETDAMSNSESSEEDDDMKSPRYSDDKDCAPNMGDVAPISTSDPILPRYHKCITCGKLFTNKNALTDHTNGCYSVPCNLCIATFRSLRAWEDHVKTAHEGVVPHQCQICKTKFRWKSHLAVHMVIRHENGEKNLSCVKCGKKFCLEENLARHLSLHDIEGSKPLVCDVCDDRFEDETSLKRHLTTHTKRFQCSQCPQRCRSRNELERHLKTHSTEKPEKCPHCDYASCHKYNLPHHIARVHPVGPATHICHICGKAFHHPADLKTHLSRHDGVKCDTCGKKFTTRTSLHSHLIKVHGKDPFVCDECGATFSTWSGVITHKEVHAGEASHKCETCGACFAVPGKLKDHMRTHTGERPFPCPHCDKAFKTTSDMKKHVKVIHTPGYVTPTPHKCPHCEKKFPSSSSLERHIRQVHTGERPFPCPYCKKASKTRGNLKKHVMVIHTPGYVTPTPHKCPHCDKKFRSACLLRRHVRQVHTGERPFPCDKCGKGFAVNARLTEHLKRVHGVVLEKKK